MIFFPRSLVLLAILGGLLLVALLLMFTNESNKIAFPQRYSSYPFSLFLAGLIGMAMTGLMWGLLHLFDW